MLFTLMMTTSSLLRFAIYVTEEELRLIALFKIVSIILTSCKYLIKHRAPMKPSLPGMFFFFFKTKITFDF